MQVDITTPQFFDLNFRADEDWLRSSGTVLPSPSQIQAIPGEVVLYCGEEKLALQDIYAEMALEVSKSEEVSAPKVRSFHRPTFLKIPTEPALVKVTSLSVGVTLRRTSEEREFRLQNVAMFVLKDLKDGVVHRFAQFP